jgi:transcriptional regulator with XRE-family HTH domain
MDMRPLPELAEYRERQNPPLSRGDLAKQLDVSSVTIFRWEKGQRRPDKRYIPTIAEMTGVSPLELMGVSE